MRHFWVGLAVLLSACQTGMEYAGRTEIDLDNSVWLDQQQNPISKHLKLKVNSGKEQGKIDAMFESKPTDRF